MSLYALLSKIPFLRSYPSKFLFVAFLGVHIPLIGTVLFMVFYPKDAYSPIQVLLWTLGFTLAGTALTLWVLHHLLKPILLAKDALRTYVAKRQVTEVPVNFTDEVGVLLQDVQHTMISFDAILKENKDLMATLSHDLRAPASNIMGLVQRLNDRPVSKEELPLYLKNIEKSGQRQLQLMNSVMLLLEEEDNLSSPIQKEKVGLATLVQTVIAEHAQTITEKQLQVHQEIAPDLKVKVAPDFFERVITNLLVNAIKFSKPGQLIQVLAKRTTHEVLLSFVDQGVGFKEGINERLFDRFTRFRRVGTAGEATNGIGLYLCQRIMQLHGGSITAYSAGAGKGATFTIHLPEVK